MMAVAPGPTALQRGNVMGVMVPGPDGVAAGFVRRDACYGTILPRLKAADVAVDVARLVGMGRPGRSRPRRYFSIGPDRCRANAGSGGFAPRGVFPSIPRRPGFRCVS